MAETDDKTAAQPANVLIASAQRPLSAAIADLVTGAESASLAVGYLFVEGLDPLVAVFDTVPRLRLLIGNVVNRLTAEQLREAGIPASNPAIDEFAATYRESRDRAAAETALNLTQTIAGLPRSDKNRALLIAMARWIAAGKLSVRLSTAHRLHAKVALAQYHAAHPHAPGRAIVGTTNFSMPDSSTDPLGGSNIDVILEGKRNYDQLSAWFERHWLEAQDFQRDLFTILGRCWPLSEL